jgi:hypothetical protein
MQVRRQTKLTGDARVDLCFVAETVIVEISDAGREVCAWDPPQVLFEFGILRIEQIPNRRISIEESTVEIEQHASDHRSAVTVADRGHQASPDTPEAAVRMASSDA